jgi:hypothetical protein
MGLIVEHLNGHAVESIFQFVFAQDVLALFLFLAVFVPRINRIYPNVCPVLLSFQN